MNVIYAPICWHLPSTSSYANLDLHSATAPLRTSVSNGVVESLLVRAQNQSDNWQMRRYYYSNEGGEDGVFMFGVVCLGVVGYFVGESNVAST